MFACFGRSLIIRGGDEKVNFSSAGKEYEARDVGQGETAGRPYVLPLTMRVPRAQQLPIR